MYQNDMLADGKLYPQQQRDWTLYYVELIGSQLTSWAPPPEMRSLAASLVEMGGIANGIDQNKKLKQKMDEMKTQQTPTYINLSDGTIDWIGIFRKGNLSCHRFHR